MEFGNKIRFAVSVNGFIYVCSNRCRGTKKLFYNRCVFFWFWIFFVEENDLSCKLQRLIKQWTFHTFTSIYYDYTWNIIKINALRSKATDSLLFSLFSLHWKKSRWRTERREKNEKRRVKSTKRKSRKCDFFFLVELRGVEPLISTLPV